VGKQADIVVLDAPTHEHLCYHFGVNLVDTVVKNGKVVVEGGQRLS
jgi:imidazolonepropionase